MPTYVYECAKCGEEFEVWQSIKDDPLKRHGGACRGKLAKVIQPAGIVLKGSGFYKNDSRGGSKRSSVPSASDTSSSASNGDSSSSDAKGSSESKSSSDAKPTSKSDSRSGSSSSGNGSTSKKKSAKTSSS